MQFLLGRLLGYLGFALLAWMTSLVILQHFPQRQVVLGIAYMGLAGLLFLYSFLKPKQLCAMNSSTSFLQTVAVKWPLMLPICLGLLTGLNLCPPFLLVFTEAVNATSLGNSLVFFWAFFLGTSIYFLPIPLLGFLHRFPQLQTVGKMTATLIALYYMYIGLMMVGGI